MKILALATLPLALLTVSPRAEAARPAAYPDANALIKSSGAKLKTVDTYHVNMTMKMNLIFVVGSLLAVGDASAKNSASFMHTTGKTTALGKPENTNEYEIQIKNQSWVKSAQTKNRWKRTSTTATSSTGSSTTDPFNLNTKTTKLISIKTVGASRVGSTAVWHLVGTIRDTSNPGSPTTGTVEFLIGQSDNLPYQFSENVTDKKTGIYLKIVMQMSNFGEKVSIPTPTVGSTTP